MHCCPAWAGPPGSLWSAPCTVSWRARLWTSLTSTDPVDIEEVASTRAVMCRIYQGLPDLATYTKQRICDNTLDDAQLATRCPLDNVRCGAMTSLSRHSAGQLDQLPAEILVQVLLCTDIPSLTGFRRVNHRARELVDSVPEYAAIIKHCPDVIRAILSIQADAFDCSVLYKTLGTTRCSTCERFGDHLYLITCRRVCYFCFTRRLEYCPLTMGRALRFVNVDETQESGVMTSRQRLRSSNPPSVLSLPGRYCAAGTGRGGNLQRTRLQLFDRRAVIQDDAGFAPMEPDKSTREPRRFMAIMTVPYLFDFGRQADWGYFCLGCNEEKRKRGTLGSNIQEKRHWGILRGMDQ